MAASRPVELQFGRHALDTFGREPFVHWSVSGPLTEHRTHWRIEHAGHVFSVKKARLYSEQAIQGNQLRHPSVVSISPEHLVHVLKDPVRRQNLLVIRKAEPENPFGVFSAYSVFPSGDEEFMGFVRLSSNTPDSTLLSGVGVAGYALRKPSSIAGVAAQFQRAADLDALQKLIHATSTGNAGPSRPSGMRSWRYRGRRLGHLLTVLAEDVSRASGAREIYASWSRKTASHVTRHGWIALGKTKKSSMWCRKLLGPEPTGLFVKFKRWLGFKA